MSTLQVVIVWILGEAAIEEGPSEVVYCVLCVLNGTGDDLGVKMVLQQVVKLRFDRQRLL